MRDRHDCALGNCAKRLYTRTDTVDLAAADCLALACVQDTRSSDDLLSQCRANVVDLELRCDHSGSESAATRTGEGVVGSVRDDPTVNKSVLLLQLLSDGQSKFCSAGPKRDDFRIQQ